MPIDNFPMRRIGDREGFAPYLNCSFSNPWKRDIPAVPLIALVDTGSTACSVPVDLAEALGHNVERGEAHEIETAGDPVLCWRHTFTLQVFHLQALDGNRIYVDPKHIVIELPLVQVDVLDSDTCALLGVRGFLENYTLIADFPQRVFSIKDYRPTRGIRGI